MNLIKLILLVISLSSYQGKLRNEVVADFQSVDESRVLIQLEPLQYDTKSIIQSEEHIKRLHQRLMDHNFNSLKELKEHLKEDIKKGYVKDIRSYYISNTIVVTLNKQVLDKLVSKRSVMEISSNKAFKLDLPKGNNKAMKWDSSKPHWSLTFINATNISEQTKLNASKLLYGNADSGIDFKHIAVTNTYRGNLNNNVFDHNYNWYDGNYKNNSTLPYYDSDHGTHTLSTAIGGVNLGVSPTTKWIACKNMNNNLGTPETYISCLQFMLAPTDLSGNNPKIELRPHVVGNSYGCPKSEGCSETSLNEAIKTLKTFGVFMSVSAGNDGFNGCSSIEATPANDPNSFTVASSDYKSFTRSYFSSMGPVKTRNIAIDITAPGSYIMGAIPGNKYDALDGTSMASPHISGAALLIMAECPNLERQVDKVAEILRKSATPLVSNERCGGDSNTKVPNNEFGYGIVNVKKALQLCKKY